MFLKRAVIENKNNLIRIIYKCSYFVNFIDEISLNFHDWNPRRIISPKIRRIFSRRERNSILNVPETSLVKGLIDSKCWKVSRNACNLPSPPIPIRRDSLSNYFVIFSNKNNFLEKKKKVENSNFDELSSFQRIIHRLRHSSIDSQSI